MNNTIKEEIAQHIIDNIDHHLTNNTELCELHQVLFNNEYYVIGHYEAELLLKYWEVTGFEAIEYVQNYEVIEFGEPTTKINPESIVNMLVYIVGESVLSDTLHALGLDCDLELTTYNSTAIKSYLVNEYGLEEV